MTQSEPEIWKSNNFVKGNRKKSSTKSVPTYQLENKNIESHNNDRVEEVDQVEANNNINSINRQYGTCNVKFKIFKWLSTKQSNPLNTICVKCYAKFNNDRLPSVVLQVDNFFPLSIIDNDFHTQGIATDVTINFERYTNNSLQQQQQVYVAKRKN